MMRRALASLALVAALAVPSWAGFPVVQSRATSGQATSVTTHTVTMPAGVQSGDFLTMTVAFAGGSDPTVAVPSGWTQQFEFACGSDIACWQWMARKVADGSEGASLDVTTSSSTRSAHSVLRVSNYVLGTGGLQCATGNPGTDPDPATVTPSGGLGDYLFVASMSIGDIGIVSLTPPTNYSNLNWISRGSSPAVTVATAERTLTASSENPGSFTPNDAGNWGACTFALAGSASATRRRLILSKPEPFDPLRWFLRGGEAFAAEARP
jgi:hypothetical protein